MISYFDNFIHELQRSHTLSDDCKVQVDNARSGTPRAAGGPILVESHDGSSHARQTKTRARAAARWQTKTSTRPNVPARRSFDDARIMAEKIFGTNKKEAVEAPLRRTKSADIEFWPDIVPDELSFKAASRIGSRRVKDATSKCSASNSSTSSGSTFPSSPKTVFYPDTILDDAASISVSSSASGATFPSACTHSPKKVNSGPETREYQTSKRNQGRCMRDISSHLVSVTDTTLQFSKESSK